MNLNRTCIKCGTPFILELKPYAKTTNICLPCRREYQKKYSNKKSKVALEGKKENYPIPDNERRAKFVKIQKELAGIKVRSEWQAYLKDKLDNLDPKIIKWIFDRRDKESNDEERSRKNKKTDYEDTRNSHENQSWFD